jgi:hypothetical protein
MWQNVNLFNPQPHSGFHRDFFLGIYRSEGMIDRRSAVADFLENLQAHNQTAIDLDVYQCLCSNFNAQVRPQNDAISCGNCY